MAEDDDTKLASPAKMAEVLYGILNKDLDRLETIDDYLRGIHPDPYMPDNADAEYRMLATRAVTNHCPLLVDTPAQALYVDGFRRGSVTASSSTSKAGERRNLPEWLHFEESRMQARQDAVTRAALGFGHAFVLTEKQPDGKVISKGLSPLRTVAIYEDPANDDNAVAVLHVRAVPTDDKRKDGRAWLWDRTNRYDMRFGKDESSWVIEGQPIPHGLDGENPVTRFAAAVDLEGRTVGVVEPYLRIQDRINQTVFDLLVAQTAGSFKTRWATGMAPPMQMEPVYARRPDGEIIIDEETGEKVVEEWRPRIDPNTGNPMPAPIDLNAKRFLFGEDDEVRFGTLDETPLAPYVEAVDLAVRHLSALSQTPPHHLLGQIANLSAEALQAAETALSRKVDNFKSVFGESWERVFRIALLLSGEQGGDDMTGQVIWRDMGAQAMSKTVDALVKLKDIGVPERALWPMVPGTDQGVLTEWEALADEEGSLGIDREQADRALSFMEQEDDDLGDDNEREDAGSTAGV